MVGLKMKLTNSIRDTACGVTSFKDGIFSKAES
jgi:hypothetical protein